MKTTLRIAAVIAIVGTLAVGATQWTPILNLRVPGKVLVGTTVEGNSVTRVLAGSVVVDFDGGTLGCTTIASGLVGVRQGDRCHLGSTTPFTANNTFECNPTDAGEVTITNCHLGVASDPASATYNFTVISHQ